MSDNNGNLGNAFDTAASSLFEALLRGETGRRSLKPRSAYDLTTLVSEIDVRSIPQMGFRREHTASLAAHVHYWVDDDLPGPEQTMIHTRAVETLIWQYYREIYDRVQKAEFLLMQDEYEQARAMLRGITEAIDNTCTL